MYKLVHLKVNATEPSVWNPLVSTQGNHMQTIGFYGPDPGGHQPFQILKDYGNGVRVRQLIDGVEIDVDQSDLMDLTGLKSRIHEVMNGERFCEHGPMADMREPQLRGYLSTLKITTEAAFPATEIQPL